MIALYEQPIFGRIVVDEYDTPTPPVDVLILGVVYDADFSESDAELRFVVGRVGDAPSWYGTIRHVSARRIVIHVPPAEGEAVPSF